MSRVFKTEFGEYLTYPDGDKATQEEIIAYEIEKRGYIKINNEKNDE